MRSKGHDLHDYKLEMIQRRATKYIRHDYTSDYKSRLMALKTLLFMEEYVELNDIVFCVRTEVPCMF